MQNEPVSIKLVHLTNNYCNQTRTNLIYPTDTSILIELLRYLPLKMYIFIHFVRFAHNYM